MSFIDFESGTDKERAREELRQARSDLLKKARKDAFQRDLRDVEKQMRGDDQWMLPDVARKLEPGYSEQHSTHKKSKKEKKDRKEKRKKAKKSKKRDSSSSSSAEEQIKKKKKRKKRMSTSSSSSDSEEVDEWVEKEKVPEKPVERDDWMSGILIPTFSKNKNDEKKQADANKDAAKYNPATSTRELNPHWKDGGTGIPTFRKPTEENDDNSSNRNRRNAKSNAFDEKKGNWRKKKEESRSYDSPSSSKSFDQQRSEQKRASGSFFESDPRWGQKQKSPQNRDGSSDDSHWGQKRKSPERNNVEPKWGQKQKSPQRSRSNSNSSSESIAKNNLTEEKNPFKKDPDRPKNSDFLTDQQMNQLGAKLLKAEMLEDTDLVNELKDKLDRARNYRNNYKEELMAKKKSERTQKSRSNNKIGQNEDQEEVVLTTTNSRGVSHPVNQRQADSDPWGGRKGAKMKRKPVATHEAGERIKFFADDDRYNLQQMFESEKLETGADQDAQFANIISKHKNPNDDLEDIFADKVRKDIRDDELDAKDRNRAIAEHQQMVKTLEACQLCFESTKMERQLIVSMGKNVYLSLPWHEPLQQGHCIIAPMQHVTCATQLDEDVWEEVSDFRKALTRMFASKGQDVIFFEVARYLNRKPHLAIHCVASKEFEMAPFYFKKAIQESEMEWSVNKQLVELKEKRDVRRSIPKGLPYFWVNFGMDSGFAHVIEDQETFPSNFAQEVIGGLLNLDARLWRRPRKEQNPIPKVKQFANMWKPFDCTVKN